MKNSELKILPVELLTVYCLHENSISGKFNELRESEISVDAFSFYISVSAVFSSKIEGEQIELDSFIKHKLNGAKFLPDHTQKIDDLYAAYIFAQTLRLNLSAVKQAHQSLTKHILQKSQQGKLRTNQMYVITPDGNIEYLACLPSQVKGELNKLFKDIKLLMNIELSVKETFFFASMIHLVFVKIHPFYDGNGRTARLLEKWFLAEKLGAKAWFLQSEKFYYNKHDVYYKNIRALGLEYDQLNYSKALPFLEMLPQALIK